MKLLINIYFYMFPLVLIPFMFLLYDGNIFLYNMFSIIIVFIFIINGLLLKKEEVFVDLDIYTVSIQKYRVVRKTTFIIFVVASVILFFRYMYEVMSSMGSV